MRRWQIVRLIDFDDPAANDWLAVNQFTVIEGQHNRRPDIVVFCIAGAQTVLASHWPVNDKAPSQLMTEFIRRLCSGEPRAKAWREAQLSLLHSNEFQNPYFWAAFTLTGQWR